MVVDMIISFNGIDMLWLDDNWLPEVYMEQMGTVLFVELCGC